MNNSVRKFFPRIFTVLLNFLALCGIADAQVVNTVANGNWSSGATWSTGSVPGPNAQITILHTVTMNMDCNIGTSGRLTVSSSGRINGTGSKKIMNENDIINNGRVVVYMLENKPGSTYICNNYDRYSGSMINEGIIDVYGDMSVLGGDLVNKGSLRIQIGGYLYCYGTFM